jgi:hypothetical protein
MAREDATGPNELFADLPFTDVNSSAALPRSMPLRPILCSKRAREEPNEQTRSPKRVKFVKEIMPHGEALMNATSSIDAVSNHKGAVVAAAPTAASQTATQVNAGIDGASMVPDVLVMNDWRVDDVSNTSTPLWPGLTSGITYDSSMPTDVVPQDMPQQAEPWAWADTLLGEQTLGRSQSGFSCSATDVAFTVEMPLEEILREFNVGDVTGDVPCFEESNTDAKGVVTYGGAHLEAIMKVDHVGMGSGNYDGGDDGECAVVSPGDYNGDAASSGLPDMMDNDEDWLKEAIQDAITFGILDLPAPE